MTAPTPENLKIARKACADERRQWGISHIVAERFEQGLHDDTLAMQCVLRALAMKDAA